MSVVSVDVKYVGFADPQPTSVEEARLRGGTVFKGWLVPFGHGTPVETVKVYCNYQPIVSVGTKKQKGK